MNRETMEWIDALLEGSLPAERFDELQQRLRDDPVAFEHYCSQAELHGRLEWELRDAAASAEVPERKIVFLKRWLRPIAAAAALVAFGGVLGYALKPVRKEIRYLERPDAVEIGYVARLTQATGAKWRSGHPEVGQWLATGVVELTEGSAQIAFDSGASVRLQAPARLDVSSPNHARLDLGKSIVDIPEQAVGFVMETPNGELRRRGSRFGVAVEEDGHTEVHVLAGEVELNPKRGNRDSLKLSQSKPIRLADAGVTNEAPRYAPADFGSVARTDSALMPKTYLHWSFDSVNTTTGTFDETGVRLAGENPFPASVVELKGATHPTLVAGRFGTGVKLEGFSSVISTRFPGYAGNQARTVAFWVMVPQGTPDTFSYSILSWGSASPGNGGKWQIAWNNSVDNTGTKGALRVEVQGGASIGSTDLRDGKWHHVAVVFPGGPRSSTNNIRYYIDGRLDSSTYVKTQEVNTVINGPNSFPLTIGHRVDSESNYSFRGSLDELYVFPVALLPESIEALYQRNTPPGLY
ncbi:FecR domain-containing protein [Luteolibacter ambystomatis]|uniref:FecR domain-containing protein n=1 Tax=Luteolibacter ambystomatis TaxID=2824561 RepID=A0A975IZF0_9BACT|nr:LamG-like jellyroll fold domain-containing protein [Luteolibacter ambystomatis]QUE51119.1 FecR domain-containing protein [Luteolibacter ambystomatis]